MASGARVERRVQVKAEFDKPAGGKNAALLIVDMINALDFEGGADLLQPALEAVDHVLDLRGQADSLRIPVVYVNDNFGQWHSERDRLIEHCRRPGVPGRELVDRITPREDDYFVTKPMLSGFYATNLQVLLPQLGASRLVVTGLVADICVLFTAADAHMRDYRIWAPSDCTVATNTERKGWAMEIMAQALGAETRPTTDLNVDDWLSS